MAARPVDSSPLVPWTRWPVSSRSIEQLRVELGHRAAHDLIVRPFPAWNGPAGPRQ